VDEERRPSHFACAESWGIFSSRNKRGYQERAATGKRIVHHSPWKDGREGHGDWDSPLAARRLAPVNKKRKRALRRKKNPDQRKKGRYLSSGNSGGAAGVVEFLPDSSKRKGKT